MVLSASLLVITVISLLYAAGKAGYALQEKVDASKYWLWLAIAGIGFVLAEIYFALLLIKRRRENY